MCSKGMHQVEFTFFHHWGNSISKFQNIIAASEEKKGDWFKTEFCLPKGILASASGGSERVDMVCGDCEQAEDFCDHDTESL